MCPPAWLASWDSFCVCHGQSPPRGLFPVWDSGCPLDRRARASPRATERRPPVSLDFASFLAFLFCFSQTVTTSMLNLLLMSSVPRSLFRTFHLRLPMLFPQGRRTLFSITAKSLISASLESLCGSFFKERLNWYFLLTAHTFWTQIHLSLF